MVLILLVIDELRPCGVKDWSWFIYYCEVLVLAYTQYHKHPNLAFSLRSSNHIEG